MANDFEEKSGWVCTKTSWGRWGQSIDDVTLEIDLKPGISSKSIICVINTGSISVTVENTLILEGKLYGIIIKDESLWTLEDKKLLIIVLQKSKQDASNCWKSLFSNGQYSVDTFTFQEMEKKLTLERFQREHPGMDFSKAELTGNYHGGGPQFPT